MENENKTKTKQERAKYKEENSKQVPLVVGDNKVNVWHELLVCLSISKVYPVNTVMDPGFFTYKHTLSSFPLEVPYNLDF